MDSLISGAISFSTLVGLVYDANNRGRFNSFLNTNKDGDFILVEGIIKTDNPQNSKDTLLDVLVKHIKTEREEYSTYIGSETIYSDRTRSITLPVRKTLNTWVLNDENIYASLWIKIQNYDVYFNKDCIFDWDRTRVYETDTIRTTEKVMVNNQVKAIFGRCIQGMSCHAKYIGNPDFVRDKIRYNHFNISGLKTYILGLTFTISTSYFIGTMFRK